MDYIKLLASTIKGTGVDVNVPKPTGNELIQSILNIVYFIVGIVAVGMIIYAGIQYLTANGEPDKAKKAMNTIIYISGLQTVPEDVYEAGSLDGATGWKQFRHLTFPLIIPFFTINMVLCVKNFLMVFDQIMAMTKGGPAQSTESISYLIYNNGMSGGQFGFQSANAVIFFIVIVAISAAQMTISSRKEEQL